MHEVLSLENFLLHHYNVSGVGEGGAGGGGGGGATAPPPTLGHDCTL